MTLAKANPTKPLPWLSKSICGLYLLTFAIIGLLVAYVGFCDPDTCWHLALGKFIFLNGALPQSDPFSSNVYSFVHLSDALPLIQHEWLSDLLLFAVYKNFAAQGLLVFVACMSTTSLVLMPSFLLQRNGAPRILILLMTSLAALASGFRLWARPEQFSFLSLALLIISYDACLRSRNRREVIFACLSVFAIMAFWTNCHALFLIGVVYSVGYVCLAIIDAVRNRSMDSRRARAFFLFGVVLLSTLCTPWQLKMWQYIGKLMVSPLTYDNKENGPIGISDLTHPTTWPLIVVILLSWTLFFICNKRRSVELTQQQSADSTDTKAIGQVSQADRPASLIDAVLLLAAGTAISLLYRRLTPIGLLLIFDAVSTLCQTPSFGNFKSSYDANGLASENQGVTSAKALSRFFAQSDFTISQLGLPISKASILSAFVLTAFTCYSATTWLVPPQLPSESRLFHPPYQAIAFLQQVRLQGRLLNDSKFGSMMTWTMLHPPDIFIDGRFDSYERSVVADYNTMRLCRPGWYQLLERYGITYVFFPPDTPIIHALMVDTRWQVYFTDRTATILFRRQTGGAH